MTSNRDTRTHAVTPLRVAVASALAACLMAPVALADPAQAQGNATATTGAHSGVAAEERKFLNDAVAGSEKEIAAARLARKQASSDKVRDMSRQIERDHLGMIAQVQQAATALGIRDLRVSPTVMAATAGMQGGSTRDDVSGSAGDTAGSAAASGSSTAAGTQASSSGMTGNVVTGTGNPPTTGHGADRGISSYGGSHAVSEGDTTTPAATASGNTSTAGGMDRDDSVAGSTGGTTSGSAYGSTGSGASSASGAGTTGTAASANAANTAAMSAAASSTGAMGTTAMADATESAAYGKPGKAGTATTDDQLLRQHGELVALSKRHGADFDRAFAAQMVKDHQKSVDKFTKASTDASMDPTIRSLASQALPTLRSHLEMARMLQSELGARTQ